MESSPLSRKFVKPLAVPGGLLLLLGAALLLFWGRGMLFGAFASWGVGAVLLLFALSFAVRNQKTGRSLRRAVAGVLLFGVLVFGGLEGIVIACASGSAAPEEPDALIVLGAALWDGEPSPVLRQRLNSAAEWLSEHPDTPVVVTGGVDTGETRSEAEVMAEELIAAGVPEDRILLETEATNTLANLTNSVTVLREAGISTESLMVLSSAPHLARVRLLAGRLSLFVGTVPAKVPGGSLYQAYLYAREAAGLVKSFLVDWG